MQTISMKNAKEFYQKQDVLTASPAELIVMLYDGLQKDLLLAQRAIKKRDMAAAHKNLMKSQAIITELSSSLDMSYQISSDLAALYDFMLRHLIMANVKKDEKMVGEVMELVDELRGAWKEVCGSQKGLMYKEANL